MPKTGKKNIKMARNQKKCLKMVKISKNSQNIIKNVKKRSKMSIN